jgi:hypothetical protein
LVLTTPAHSCAHPGKEVGPTVSLRTMEQQPSEPAVAPAPIPPGGLTPEAIEQLKALAQLHDQGILTDQEFDQQKAKILAG